MPAALSISVINEGMEALRGNASALVSLNVRANRKKIGALLW